jgi:electron transfer flavoprotein beta subunit
MNVIVCFKITPDAGDIQIRPDGTISLERAEWKIGAFDLQAIEAGVRLAEATGGRVTVLSAGPRQIDSSILKKDVLSRGPDQLYLVVDDRLKDADTHTTAQVLTEAIRKIGSFDVVLCGEGSADLYFQQVGIQLGELLCLPTLNAISQIQPEEDKLVVERSLEDEIEVLEVPLPAVLSVTTDINPTRLPGMKQILMAAKKPVTTWALADLGLDGQLSPQVQSLKTEAPPRVERKRVMIPGSPQEAAKALADYLAKEGLL